MEILIYAYILTVGLCWASAVMSELRYSGAITSGDILVMLGFSLVPFFNIIFAVWVVGTLAAKLGWFTKVVFRVKKWEGE